LRHARRAESQTTRVTSSKPTTTIHTWAGLCRAADLPADVTPTACDISTRLRACASALRCRTSKDALGHADPRTTTRYDRSRHNLDSSPNDLLTRSLTSPIDHDEQTLIMSTADGWELTVPDDANKLLAELRRHGVMPGQRLRVVPGVQQDAHVADDIPPPRRSITCIEE
jgi:hypothetical protein